MIYLFYGNDEYAIRSHAIEKAKTLAGGIEYVTHLTPEECDESTLRDACERASLFGGEQVYVVDTPSHIEVCVETVYEMLASLAQSKNHFVIIEKALLVVDKKRYAQYTQDIHEFSSGVEKKTHDTFALCDAICARDKKRAWLCYTEMRDVRIEEIVGVLFWQIKVLRLAERTASAEEAGQKPYPYKKAKQALSNFHSGEVDALSRSLVTLYHEGHTGARDMREALEAWILNI